MDHRFIRTEAGREEIKAKSRGLSRVARTLLLLIDGSRPGMDWVALIQGATATDLQQLSTEGLIERADPVAAAGDSGHRPKTLEEALSHLEYDQLYTLLTSQAKDRLGLFKGFRFVLEVEKCSGVAELRVLAVKLVAQVREQQGEAQARHMARALGVG